MRIGPPRAAPPARGFVASTAIPSKDPAHPDYKPNIFTPGHNPHRTKSDKPEVEVEKRRDPLERDDDEEQCTRDLMECKISSLQFTFPTSLEIVGHGFFTTQKRSLLPSTHFRNSHSHNYWIWLCALSADSVRLFSQFHLIIL